MHYTTTCKTGQGGAEEVEKHLQGPAPRGLGTYPNFLDGGIASWRIFRRIAMTWFERIWREEIRDSGRVNIPGHTTTLLGGGRGCVDKSLGRSGIPAGRGKKKKVGR